MRHKGQAQALCKRVLVVARRRLQLLDDLRQVTMPFEAVGADILVLFAEKRAQFETAPGAADAGQGVDDNIRLDEAAAMRAR